MLSCLKASWMNYNLVEAKRKEKAKFLKVNGNIKIRYRIHRRGSDLQCFYFSQRTTNTFPEFVFLDSLLFNWFVLISNNWVPYLLIIIILQFENDAFKWLILLFKLGHLFWINFFSGWLSSTCMSDKFIL